MHLVSQTAFAKVAGVAQGTVCVAAKRDGVLHPARVGQRIDIEHPVALEYIEARVQYHTNDNIYERRVCRRDSRDTPPARPARPAIDDGDYGEARRRLDALAKDIRALAHRPLSELVTQFGDDIRFTDWLKAIKEIEAIDEKRLKNAELRGRLVSRNAVELSIVAVVDQLFRQLLQDGCKNMAVKANAMAKGDKDVSEITEYLRSVMSTYFRASQKNMINALDDLERELKDKGGDG